MKKIYIAIAAAGLYEGVFREDMFDEAEELEVADRLEQAQPRPRGGRHAELLDPRAGALRGADDPSLRHRLDQVQVRLGQRTRNRDGPVVGRSDLHAVAPIKREVDTADVVVAIGSQASDTEE